MRVIELPIGEFLYDPSNNRMAKLPIRYGILESDEHGIVAIIDKDGCDITNRLYWTRVIGSSETEPD